MSYQHLEIPPRRTVQAPLRNASANKNTLPNRPANTAPCSTHAGNRSRFVKFIVATLAVCTLNACGFLNKKNAHWNKKFNASDTGAGIQYQTRNRPGSNADTLFILATSGGGSRAAVLSTLAMLTLENNDSGVNLLDEVDAISSVSGGSLPAAYYAIAQTDSSGNCGADKKNPDSRPVWNQQVAMEKMTSNFQGSWIRRWFLPQNILRFWFTAFDRSDIMAQVFAKKLGKYSFGDICDDKPGIFINATRATFNNDRASTGTGTADIDKTCTPENERQVGGIFTFIDCEFNNLDSSLATYPIANAVIASSAFPAVFNYTTLRDFRPAQDARQRYIHLYDGGSRDNLGLTTATEIINSTEGQFKRVVVMLVDAYLEPPGISETKPDARLGFDFFVDTNFLDSIDILLSTNRDKTISDLKTTLEDLSDKRDINTFFYHLTFSDLAAGSTATGIKTIKTRFKIEKEEIKQIRRATEELFNKDQGICLEFMKEMVTGEPLETARIRLPENASCVLNTRQY